MDPRKIRLIMALRQAGIADARVLAAIERVPREVFVPETFRDRAYEDVALPTEDGQTVSQPQMVAAMTEALALAPRMTVLEIGTGSGYQAAVLARLCRRVYTMERHARLLRQAEARFAALGIRNVTTRLGDGAKGWPELAPFARIIVTAGAETIPQALERQLAPGGLMIVPVGRNGSQRQLLRHRRTDDGFATEPLRSARFVPLV